MIILKGSTINSVVVILCQSTAQMRFSGKGQRLHEMRINPNNSVGYFRRCSSRTLEQKGELNYHNHVSNNFKNASLIDLNRFGTQMT